MNVVLLQGRLSRPAEVRELPSGDRLVALEVTTRTGAVTDTVPVVWFDAPARATTLTAGDGVVVSGRVRRRFFRAAGGTQSRTEVVADAVVRSRARQASALVARALAHLDEVGPAPGI